MSQSYHILCVEDDAGIAYLMQMALETENYVVSLASNGKEGLQLAKERLFDVILIDQNMPEMSGLDLINHLQVLENTPPIIMITGAGNELLAVEAMRAGASDYLVKDTNLSYLKILPVIMDQCIQNQALANSHQQARQALQEEQLRSEVLRQFIQDASHEFRTPLSIIRTSTELLSRISQQPKQHQYIKQIQTQANAILELVQDLILLSELDNNPPLDLVATRPAILLRDIIEQKMSLFQQKSMEIKLDSIDDTVHTLIDAHYLGHALSELLDNAYRYSGEKGQLEVSLNREGLTAILTIVDKGIGIEAEHIPHVFKRFYRGDSAHSTRGFGLGLPIAAKVIELHQGDIQLQSQPGQGTSVAISLPLQTVLAKV